jgi:beta propeller repeat protein
MYDLSTKKIKKVSPSTKQQDFPSIYGNIITWNDYRNIQGSITGYSDIYAYDLSKNKVTRVTPKTGYYGHPKVYGNFIFYWDGSGDHSYIYKYDITNGSRKAILKNPGSNFDISGNKIAYVYYNGDEYFLYGDGGEIYIKNYQTDLLSNKGIPVCTENHTQYNPAISGGSIVWEDNRNGPNNIYLADYTAPKLTKTYPKHGSTIAHWCDYDDVGFILYFNEIVQPGPKFAGISVKNLSNNKYLPITKEFTSYLSYVPNRGETVWIWGPYQSTVWRSLKNVWCLLTVPAGAFKDINGNLYNKPIYIKVFLTDTW